MIAAGVGDHSCRFLRLTQLAYSIVRAAKLERANALKIFALQVNLVPCALVEGAGSVDWGAVGKSLNAAGGF
jgi:hypothetical protein